MNPKMSMIELKDYLLSVFKDLTQPEACAVIVYYFQIIKDIKLI